MNADIKGALEQINSSYRAFEHKGKRMTKQQVKKVLEYGLVAGYKHTGEIPENEIDAILQQMTLSDVLKSLNKKISHAIKQGVGLHDLNWGEHEGVLISVNEAKQISYALSWILKEGPLFTFKLKKMNHKNAGEGESSDS